jgi:3-methyl-2-oxobutanoate hydroxymethyltransferase
VAEILDPHCDLLLVGDSVGMVVHGLPNTVGVTLEMMILHGQAVMRGARRAMVVVDMPFGSYEGGPEIAFANATRLLKETGAQAVKVEAGPSVGATIAYLVERGVPVMGHVGLRPQAVNVDGKFRAKGRTKEERAKVLAEARAADKAGAFAIVIEGVDETLAPELTAAVKAPTIGIGASAQCDGQILVTDDMLGLFDWTPNSCAGTPISRGRSTRPRPDMRPMSAPAVFLPQPRPMPWAASRSRRALPGATSAASLPAILGGLARVRRADGVRIRGA